MHPYHSYRCRSSRTPGHYTVPAVGLRGQRLGRRFAEHMGFRPVVHMGFRPVEHKGFQPAGCKGLVGRSRHIAVHGASAIELISCRATEQCENRRGRWRLIFPYRHYKL